MIRAILVDDEQSALGLLEDMLMELCPQIEIIAKANSAEDAFRLISAEEPDLIFLDVAMPKESGFDLLRRLPNLNFEIIFVTGFDSYAIEAIKFCAIGYILKPIQEAELIQAVAQAKKSISEKQQHNRNLQLIHNLLNPRSANNNIAIPTTAGLEFITTSDIVRCEGIQRCTKVIIKDRKAIISSYNLGDFRKLLENYGFFSPHKSHLINFAHIQRYDREGMLEMSDGMNVPVARRRRQEFLELLKRVK